MASTPCDPGLTDLISSYAILPTLATWVSTLDLYHLALTNRAHYYYILGSPALFNKLRRFCLCDGRGLVKRQEFHPPYFSDHQDRQYRFNRHLSDDEEIEVKLYNTKCDESGALPCLKCGINVCEECRYYLRARPSALSRRPHVDDASQISNIMCLCPPCDAKVEEEMKGQFLNELCDCDPWSRWICNHCVEEEYSFQRDYFEKHTLKEGYWDQPGDHVQMDVDDDDYGDYAPSKTINDHAFDVAFWCTCGASLKQDNPVRCTWCRRRHLPENEWYHDGRDGLPFFDKDPDYPVWVTNRNHKYPTPYPRLGYLRPGEQEEST